jgi:hypothetical protein
MDLWSTCHLDPANDRRVVLSVAFRSRSPISSDGDVDGLEDIEKVESPDLFEQYLLNPVEFMAFLRQPWSKACSALLGFQIQPIEHHLPNGL